MSEARGLKFEIQHYFNPPSFLEGHGGADLQIVPHFLGT